MKFKIFTISIINYMYFLNIKSQYVIFHNNNIISEIFLYKYSLNIRPNVSNYKLFSHFDLPKQWIGDNNLHCVYALYNRINHCFTYHRRLNNEHKVGSRSIK